MVKLRHFWEDSVQSTPKAREHCPNVRHQPSCWVPEEMPCQALSLVSRLHLELLQPHQGCRIEGGMDLEGKPLTP